jgi:DNA-binding transcriptional MocR family regulator
MLSITLDRDNEEPIYRQLIRHIKTQIESGVLLAGTRLPASRDLAQQLRISRISVVNAYAELRAEGYLSAHAGRGTFVSGERGEMNESDDAGDDLRPASRNGHLPHIGAAESNTHMAVLGATISTAPLDMQPSVGDRSLRDLMRLSRKPGVINFGTGSPPSDFYPVQHLRHAINSVLDRDGAAALMYETQEGYAPLRASVRDYVSAFGIRCTADHVLITGGTQQAISLVVHTLLGEGDALLSENPTYIGLTDIARARRVRLYGVEIDQDGMRLDMLENMIVEQRPRLIYVMPTFHNPTGTVMPLHRRRQLINLATEYNVPILEDAVYQEFLFEGEALPPLAALDDNHIVIHTSAFTKNLLPGMRIGYIIADSPHYERLVRMKHAADISTPGLNQRAIHLMLERGVLAQQLERNNRELKRRRDIAIAAANRYLPPGSRWNVPQGGLYLWIELPKTGPSSAELFISAIQEGVAYAIGSVFFTDGRGSHRLRLNFAAQRPADIEEGMRRLGRAWRELAVDYAEMEKMPLL